jgi:hypothetical protein
VRFADRCPSSKDYVVRPAAVFADSVHGLQGFYAADFGAVAAVAAAVSANPACADLLASIVESVPAAALIEQL